MKEYIDQAKRYLSVAVKFMVRHSIILFVIVFAGLAGYLVARIGYLSRLEPTEAQVTSKISEVKKITTDTGSILKLKELEGRSISVESLFDNGRTNPFEN